MCSIKQFSYSIFGTGDMLDLPVRISAECGYCERFNRYTFARTLWPADLKSAIGGRKHHSFNCFTCGEMSVCGKFAFRRVDTISHEKDLKDGLLLYDETGASTETTIGRFTFKTRGENNGKQASENEQQG
jgi:hypothetical protein